MFQCQYIQFMWQNNLVSILAQLAKSFKHQSSMLRHNDLNCKIPCFTILSDTQVHKRFPELKWSKTKFRTVQFPFYFH